MLVDRPKIHETISRSISETSSYPEEVSYLSSVCSDVLPRLVSFRIRRKDDELSFELVYLSSDAYSRVKSSLPRKPLYVDVVESGAPEKTLDLGEIVSKASRKVKIKTLDNKIVEVDIGTSFENVFHKVYLSTDGYSCSCDAHLKNTVKCSRNLMHKDYFCDRHTPCKHILASIILVIRYLSAQGKVSDTTAFKKILNEALDMYRRLSASRS